MNWPARDWAQTPVVAGAAMRAADQEASSRFHISSAQLMEVAGFQLSRFASAFMGGARGRRIMVVAGSGNNGGDALVAGRHLHHRGAAVSVRLASGPPGGLGADHLFTARSLGIPIAALLPIPPSGLDAELVIDGILGTGIRLPLRQDLAQAIATLNGQALPAIAVDVPSGLDADTGAGEEECLRAAATLTLGLPKPGLRLSRAAGRLYVADIGLPPALFGLQADAASRLFEQDTIVEILPS